MLQVKSQNPAERSALQLLFAEFKDAFATQLFDISQNLPEFSITTISDDPVLLNAKYKKKFSEAERLVIETTIEQWLANGIIEPCTHPRPIVNNLP